MWISVVLTQCDWLWCKGNLLSSSLVCVKWERKERIQAVVNQAFLEQKEITANGEKKVLRARGFMG